MTEFSYQIMVLFIKFEVYAILEATPNLFKGPFLITVHIFGKSSVFPVDAFVILTQRGFL